MVFEEEAGAHNDNVPGSIGQVIYYNNKPGIFQKVSVSQMDSTILIEWYNKVAAWNMEYETKKSAFNQQASAYNSKVNVELDRR